MEISGIGFWLLQVTGWLFLAYLIYAQCISALSYKLGVRMGTQEPEENITRVGVAFFTGFAVADLVFYGPLFLFGLIGHAMGSSWGAAVLLSALAITAYWPVTCLVAVFKMSGTPGWSLPNERQYWVALPLITLWALWGMWFLISGM